MRGWSVPPLLAGRQGDSSVEVAEGSELGLYVGGDLSLLARPDALGDVGGRRFKARSPGLHGAIQGLHVLVSLHS